MVALHLAEPIDGEGAMHSEGRKPHRIDHTGGSWLSSAPRPSSQGLTALPAQLQLGSKALNPQGGAAQLAAQLISALLMVDQQTDPPGLEPDGHGEHQPGDQEPDRVIHQSGSGGLLFLQRLLFWC